MLQWHFTHCVSALGAPCRGSITEQNSSKDREGCNREHLLSPAPSRVQRVAVIKLIPALQCPMGFPPQTLPPSSQVNGMACEALAAHIKPGLVPDHLRQRATGSEVVQLHPAPGAVLAVLVLVSAQLKPISGSQSLPPWDENADEKSSLRLLSLAGP